MAAQKYNPSKRPNPGSIFDTRKETIRRLNTDKPDLAIAADFPEGRAGELLTAAKNAAVKLGSKETAAIAAKYDKAMSDAVEHFGSEAAVRKLVKKFFGVHTGG